MFASKSLPDKIIDWIIMIVLLLLGFSTLLPLINTLAISLSNKAAVSGGWSTCGR
jgi:putative aldouronate transport system permease protein